MGESVHYIFDYLGETIILIASDPLFIGLALLILYMYKRVAKQVNTRDYRYRLEYTAVKDIIRGVVIGSLFSLILDLMGVRIPLEGELFLLVPVAIALIFINPKLGCFSYVIPITWFFHELVHMIFPGINLSTQTYRQLVLLVGVLHIIEGVLVMVWGHENPREEPIQVGGKLVKGKCLTKYWPVPLIVFRTANNAMIPLVLYAFLGYGDVALRCSGKDKSRLTGSVVCIYGLCITIIGYYTIKGVVPLFLIMIVMPFIHELIFKVTLALEMR